MPSLRALVTEAAAKRYEEAVKKQGSEEENKKALKEAFTQLMESKQEEVEAQAEELLKQVDSEGAANFAGGDRAPSPGSQVLTELLPRLNGQFPKDIGLFVTFFLNFVVLQPGEAMFLKADDIHAYISGGTLPLLPSHPKPTD